MNQLPRAPNNLNYVDNRQENRDMEERRGNFCELQKWKKASKKSNIPHLFRLPLFLTENSTKSTSRGEEGVSGAIQVNDL